MESVQAQSMPITETNQLCKNLTNGKDGIVEEISKQLEDELLYGGTDDTTVDDGDALSDDALSEDSYRLRVSDDENDDEVVDKQTSEGVNKEEKEATKTELIESSSDKHGMDSVKYQDNHNINCELNSVDSKADVDFTDDYVHGQDNFCNDIDNFDLKKCPQLENNINYEFKLSNEEDYEDPDVSIKSDQSSILDNKVDDNNEQTKSPEVDENLKEAPSKSAEVDENSKEAPSKSAEVDENSKEASSKSAEPDESSKEASITEEIPTIKEEVCESECLMDSSDQKEDEICRSDASDNEAVENSDMEKKSDDIEVTPPAEEETKSPNNENISEQVNTASDIEEKQDKEAQNIVNDMNDKESHTEESSDSGIASGGQSVITSDDLSKEPSLNDDSSNSDVKDKVLDECESLDLECSEMEMNVESEVLKEKDETEAVLEVMMDVSEDSSSKRRLSLEENETIAPKKIPCIEEVSKQTEEIKETAVSIKVTAETPVTPEKPAGSIFTIKAVPTESLKKIISSNEIIDIEDDNTIDSSSIEVQNTPNGSALSPDSTKLDSEINETKLDDSPNKEIISELGIDDTKKIIKRRTRRGITLVAERDLVTRTRREAAQKAEVTVRKNIVTLNNDSDESETSDSTNLIPYNPKPRVISPNSLKRNCIDGDDHRVDSSTPKKFKTEIEKENSPYKTDVSKLETRKTLDHVRQFFLRDGKQKLKKLTQEELEELFIQKIIETITMRDEIGKLREQAKISERNQEATRLKCQQLTKQIKDFEMVLSRYAADRRNNTETATPIKINRSVGLQVNFLNQDHGVQNLRQIQAGRGAAQPRIMPKGPVNGLTPSPGDDSQNGRRGLKVRSPRRSEAPTVAPIGAPVQTPITTQPLVSTVTPSVIPVAKTIDTRNTVVTTGQQQVHQIHTNQIVLNGGTVTTQQRTTKVLTPNNKNNAEFIDLTEEVKKKNTPVSSIPPLTAIITSATNSTTVPKVQTRFQRVPTSASVTIPQSAIRVVQPAGQPTPTALVNNMSSIGGAPRFLMVQPNGATRQLVIAPNSSQIRTSTVNTRPAFSNIAYASVPSMANGAVRVVPASGTTTVQLYKVTHPAPLPEVMSYPPNPALKLPPPAPSLKISKVAHGIVLSWNMALTDKFAEIASYQLYAYQEITGMAPSSLNWKKVGDVRALPLPMACTLTQFSEGNNYHFAVRAVDTHSRYGQYSQPGNISL